jgi:replicative DNA helicase
MKRIIGVSNRSRPPLRIVSAPQADLDFTRELPHSIETEQVVLGTVIVHDHVLAQVRPLLGEDVFYRPAHALIWRTITKLADRGAAYDVVAVLRALGKDLHTVGDGDYLHTLVAAGVTAVNVGYHVRCLNELAYARRVTETGSRLVEFGYRAADLDDTEDLRAWVAAECATITIPDVRGWPEPTPLSVTGELPTFPLWALPGWLGEYCAASAEITQTPPDLAGCLALAVLAVAAAGRICVKAPGWIEPTNVFTVVVLPPGSRKSEVFAHMTAPIRAA